MLSRTVGVLLLAVGVIGFTSQFNLAEAVLDQPAQDEFVPLDSVPPEDQLPAAPLLVAAYALLWIAVVGYLWSIGDGWALWSATCQTYQEERESHSQWET